jgi:hypothetical protein
MVSLPQFVRRRNFDGTYDSACLHCVTTTGRQTSKEDVSETERKHVCEDDRVKMFQNNGTFEPRP